MNIKLKTGRIAKGRKTLDVSRIALMDLFDFGRCVIEVKPNGKIVNRHPLSIAIPDIFADNPIVRVYK